MDILAEPVTFIRKLRDLVFISQLAEHDCVSKVRKTFAPPSLFQFLPGLLLYRSCQKLRLHIIRQLGGRSMDHKTAVPGALKGNLVIGKKFPDLLLIQLSFYQGRIKIRLEKRQRLHIVLFQSSYISLFADFLIQLDLYLGEHVGQLYGVHRFQYVLLHFQMDRLFCVFKFIIAGKEQDLGSRELCLDPAGKFHTVHIGHFNIRHYHIRLKLLHHFQSFHPVIGIADDGKSKPFPVDLFHDNLYDLFLVIYQKNCIYIHIFSPNPKLASDFSIITKIRLIVSTSRASTAAACRAYLIVSAPPHDYCDNRTARCFAARCTCPANIRSCKHGGCLPGLSHKEAAAKISWDLYAPAPLSRNIIIFSERISDSQGLLLQE